MSKCVINASCLFDVADVDPVPEPAELVEQRRSGVHAARRSRRLCPHATEEAPPTASVETDRAQSARNVKTVVSTFTPAF